MREWPLEQPGYHQEIKEYPDEYFPCSAGTLFAEEFAEGQGLQKWMTTQDDAPG
jgi:hypothetical protein